MRTLEQIREGLEYLTEEQVTNPKWELDDLTKIHESLTEDDFFTYIVYQQFRPDLNEDEQDTIMKMCKIKKALADRDIKKQYAHFVDVTEQNNNN